MFRSLFGGSLQNEDDSSMPGILFPALSNILKLIPRRQEPLRSECVRVTEILQSQDSSYAKGQPVDSLADKYFLPLKLACEVNKPKVRAIALGAIHKLLSYGYLTGEDVADPVVYPPPASSKASIRQAQAVAQAAAAQAAKAAAAKASAAAAPAVTTPEISTADAPRVSASASSNAASSATAGTNADDDDEAAAAAAAAAAQAQDAAVASELVNDSDNDDDDDDAAAGAADADTAAGSTSTTRANSGASIPGVKPAAAAVAAAPAAAVAAAPSAPAPVAAGVSPRPRRLVDVLVETLYECSMYDDEQVQLSVMICLVTLVTSANCHTHDHSLLLAVRACYHIYLMSRSPVNRSTARATLTQMLNTVLQRMEALAAHLSRLDRPDPDAEADAEAAAAAAEATTTGSDAAAVAATATADSEAARQRMASRLLLLQTDAYQILRALCKLSAKPLAEPPEPIAQRSKVLSLELLLSALRTPGPVLCSAVPFVALIREELVPSLALNLTAPVEDVFRLAAALWTALVQDYRPHLKLEISSFLTAVVLEVLGHVNSTFDHKMTALDVIVSTVRDHQLVVDCFLNFDADPAAGDLFRAVTLALQRAARSSFAQPGWMTPDQESQIRVLALEGLSSIIRSLVVWARDALAGPGAAERALAASGIDPDDVEAMRALKHASASGNPLDKDDDIYETVLPRRRRDMPQSAIAAAVASDAAAAAAVGDTVTTAAAATTGAAAAAEDSVEDGDSYFVDAVPAGCEVNWAEAEARRVLREQVLARKRSLEAGVGRFNANFKKGLEHLFAHGLLERSASAMARFFYENAAVDRHQLGQYFGWNDPLAQSVVYEYAQLQDFAGLSLDEALRKFFHSFDLPRESQMIDRIIERFAAKYTADNPGLFSSADVCFVLTFSIVMLHTDAHNSKVPKKMSKVEFMNNVRGIDNGKDVNHAYLSDIYDRITTSEIKSLDQERKTASLLPPHKRLASFVREAPSLVRQMQERIRSKLRALRDRLEAEAVAQGRAAESVHAVSPTLAAIAARFRMSDAAVERAHFADAEEHVFFTATVDDVEIVPMLFDTLWPPAAATFGALLDESEDRRVAQISLDGFRYAIRIACMFHLAVARTALVNSLAKATLLGSRRRLMPKNVEAIKVLLRVAHTEGNHLGSSWAEVLMCISELDALHRTAHGGDALTGAAAGADGAEGNVNESAPGSPMSSAGGAGASASAPAATAAGSAFNFPPGSATAAATGSPAAAAAGSGAAGPPIGPVAALTVDPVAAAAAASAAVTAAVASGLSSPAAAAVATAAAAAAAAAAASGASSPVSTVGGSASAGAGRRGSSAGALASPAVALCGAGTPGARLADGPFYAAGAAAAAAAAAAASGQTVVIGAQIYAGDHHPQSAAAAAAAASAAALAAAAGAAAGAATGGLGGAGPSPSAAPAAGAAAGAAPAPAAPAAAATAAAATAAPAYSEPEGGFASAAARLRARAVLVVGAIDASLTERIFTQSASLSADAAVEFVEALRTVAETELYAGGVPRVFAVQKVLEVAYYNLNRPVPVWKALWVIIAAFFARAGCHPHQLVAMYVIDALRQLLHRFLQRPELVAANFQPVMLRPFEAILRFQASPEVRELALQCLTQTIAARRDAIQRGWPILFTVLAASARDPTLALVSASFRLVEHILSQHFALVTAPEHNAIDQCITTLIAFAANVRFPEISLEALDHLGRTAQFLSTVPTSLLELPEDPPVPAAVAAIATSTTAASAADAGAESSAPAPAAVSPAAAAAALVAAAPPQRALLLQWLLILSGLARLTGDSRLEVRTKALQTLFRVLRIHGSLFAPQVWVLVLRGVLFPILDDALHPGQGMSVLAAVLANAGAHKSLAADKAASAGAGAGAQAMRALSCTDNDADPWALVRFADDTDAAAATAAAAAAVPATYEAAAAAVLSRLRGEKAAGVALTPAPLPTPPVYALGAAAAAIMQAAAAVPHGTGLPTVLGAPATGRVMSTPETVWLQTTCLAALQTVVELFSRFYALCGFALPELLELLGRCVAQHGEDIARIGVKCVVRLLNSAGTHFGNGEWDCVVTALHAVFAAALPLDLVCTRTRGLLGLGAPAAAFSPLTGADGLLSSVLRGRAFPEYPGPESAVPVTANKQHAPAAKHAHVPAHTHAAGSAGTESKGEHMSYAAAAAAGSGVRAVSVSPAPSSVASDSDDPEAAIQHSLFPSVPAFPRRVAFDMGALVTKCKVQLILMDALFAIVVANCRFLPKPADVVGAPAAAAAAATPSADGSAHASAPVVTGTGKDERGHDVKLPASAHAPPVASGPFALADAHILAFLDMLLLSIDFARAFNADPALRTTLWLAGFLRDKQAFPPELFFHESHALQLYVQLLVLRYTHAPELDREQQQQQQGAAVASAASALKASALAAPGTHELPYLDVTALLEQRLVHAMTHVLPLYVAKSKEKDDNGRRCLDAVVVALLDFLPRLPRPEALRFARRFYPTIVQLIEYGSPAIRQTLTRLFSHGPLAEVIVAACAAE
jgi:Sec7-like guanine-nucleotide exchange factor